MGIYYQDIIKIDDCLYEDIDTAIECARKDYSDWCTVNKSYTELVNVFRDDKTGEIVIQYRYDPEQLDEDEQNDVREDRFDVEWVEMATTVKLPF